MVFAFETRKEVESKMLDILRIAVFEDDDADDEGELSGKSMTLVVAQQQHQLARFDKTQM